MFKKFLAFSVAAVMCAVSFMTPLPVSAAGIPVAITNVTPMSVSVAPGGAAQVHVSTTVAANSVTAVYENKTAAGVMQSSSATAKEWLVTFNPTMTQTATIYVGATAEVNALTVQYPLSITVTGTAAATTPAATSYSDYSSYNSFNPNVPNPSAYSAGSYSTGAYNPSDYYNFTPTQSAVTPAAPTPAPANVSINNISETSAGRTVTLTVSASDNANNVWVNFDRNVVDGGRYVQGVKSGNDWIIKFNPADTQEVEADVQEVVVSANTAYKTNGAATEEYDIEFTSSIAPPAEAQIVSVSGTSTVYYNSSATLTITTNADTNFVWVKYNNGQTVNATAPRTSGTNKIWTARFAPNATQTVTVYAGLTSGDANAKTRDYSVTYRDYYDDYYGNNNGNATITSADAEWEYGDDDGGRDYLHVEVRTNSAAQRVWFTYDGSTKYELNETTSSSNIWRTTSSGRSLTFDRDVDDIRVYVSENNSTSSYSDSDTISIDNHDGSSNGNGDITDWEADGDSSSPVDIDAGDSYFDIWVETDDDVDWVLVEIDGYGSGNDDDDEDTTPDDNGNYREWDLELNVPDDDGSYTVDIYAYDSDDDETDHVSFKINVD